MYYMGKVLVTYTSSFDAFTLMLLHKIKVPLIHSTLVIITKINPPAPAPTHAYTHAKFPERRSPFKNNRNLFPVDPI